MAKKLYLDTILDQSFDLILILNSDRLIEYTSDPKELTGYTRKEFNERSLIRMCHLEDQEYMQQMLASKDSVLFEWRLLTSSGNYIPVETSKTTFSNGKELTITRDLTDRKARHNAETDLAVQTKAREKDLYASRVSRHEFKNGLMAFKALVNGMVDIIGENASSKSLSKDLALDLNKHFKRLIEEIDEMLNFVLSEAMAKELVNGVYEAKKEKVDLTKLLNRIRGSRYETNFTPHLFPNIISDPQLVYYIFRNAISNAGKYGKLNGIIRINAELELKYLILEIINLPGENHETLLGLIDPNVIFNKGVRLHNDQHTNSISAGDGTWISKQCADALSAEECNIQFFTNETVFRLKIPITVYVEEESIKYFRFPDNTFFINFDDQKFQHMLVKRLFEEFVKESEHDKRIILTGSNYQEAISFEAMMDNLMRENPGAYFVALVDENINLSEIDISGSEVGARIIQNSNKISPLPNLLLLVRSANDGDHDARLYNSRTHGFISKMVLNPKCFLEKIVPYWTKHIGIVQNYEINSMISSDFDEEILMFKRELSEFNDRYIQGKLPIETQQLWKELHNLKGSALSMNEFVDRSNEMVEIIGKMRDSHITSESLRNLNQLINEIIDEI